VFIAANIHAVVRARVGVRGHQRFGLLGNVQYDGARLEQLELVRLDRRNLAKRSQRAIGRGRLIFGANQSLLIRDARFRAPSARGRRAPGLARRVAPSAMQ